VSNAGGFFLELNDFSKSPFSGSISLDFGLGGIEEDYG
jgi:hypothetical protein